MSVEQKHSAEPWDWKDHGVNDVCVFAADGSCVAVFDAPNWAWPEVEHGDPFAIRKANAARIVECVNALKGVPSNQIPILLRAVRSARLDQIIKLNQHNDAMGQALAQLDTILRTYQKAGMSPNYKDCLDIIAKGLGGHVK